MSVCESCRAGARPKAIPVSMDARPVKSNTRPSTEIWSMPGIHATPRMRGNSDWISFKPTCASRTPIMPPMKERTILSVRSNCTSWPRLAPSACRTAISRWRVTPRARSRFATLAQAISKTNTTAPIKMRRIGRINSVSCWRIGTRCAPWPLLNAGHCCSMARLMRFISA